MPPVDLNANRPIGNPAPEMGSPAPTASADVASRQSVERAEDSVKPNSLDERSLLLLGSAIGAKEKLLEGAKTLQLTPFAKLKEFFGFKSATGEAIRAAQRLERTLDRALERLGMEEGAAHAGYGKGMSPRDATIHLEEIVADTMALSAALGRFQTRHPDSNHAVTQGIENTKSLIESLSKQSTDSEIRELFLGNVTGGFPLDDFQRLKGVVLESAAIAAVAGAKTPDSFLRGSEASAYNKVVGHAVVEHFAEPIGAIRQRSQENGLKELNETPSILGKRAAQQLNDPSLRAGIVDDYRSFIRSVLGDSTESARTAAANLDPRILGMTGHVKDGLLEAAADGRITSSEAEKVMRSLVANNIFLRGINPELIKDYGGAANKEQAEHLKNRGGAISTLAQKHANGVAFGGPKDPDLAHLNQDLAKELGLVNAFIDEVIRRA